MLCRYYKFMMVLQRYIMQVNKVYDQWGMFQMYFITTFKKNLYIIFPHSQEKRKI